MILNHTCGIDGEYFPDPGPDAERIEDVSPRIATLVIPNWVAGFSNVIALAALLALRLGAEEIMMAEHFGDEYAAYSARTKRFVPGVW